MICVFFQLPLQNGPTTTFNVFNQKATTAASEVSATIEFLAQNG